MKTISKYLSFLVLFTSFATTVSAGEFTDVIDAFDRKNNDPFDISLTLGYERLQKTGVIKRETTLGVPNKLDYYALHDVAKFSHIQNIMNMNLEIGLFRDMSLRVGIPLILSDDRKLTSAGIGFPDYEMLQHPDGSSGSMAPFSNNTTSPTRSGVDHISVGLWWGILDQGRTETFPNWTIFLEGRFAAGETLSAACKTQGNEYCETLGFESKGGISRGINELRVGMHFSRRYGIVEPFFGIDALLGWPKDGKNFDLEGNSKGQINDMPPMKGTFDFGLEIVPWEVPAEDRKFVIGIGGGATYYSEGRDFTPLFDALGTSQYFNHPDYFVDFNGNGVNDGGDEILASDSWTGVTDIENYAAFFGRMFLMIQPAKYIKFRLGFDIGHETSHFITKTDQCPAGNVIYNTSTGNSECSPYNHGHRPEIDKPGSRFRAADTLMWSLFIDATAQF